MGLFDNMRSRFVCQKHLTSGSGTCIRCAEEGAGLGALGQNVTNPSLDLKASNPKDAIGSTKLPLDLVPDTLLAYAATSFAEGASKYGSFNWRVAGVRASIYRAALGRHLAKWWNGEDIDPVTKVPHLASVIACAGIILDAEACGKLTDDRPPRVDVGAVIERLEGAVKHVRQLNAHMNPHHNTQADSA